MVTLQPRRPSVYDKSRAGRSREALLCRRGATMGSTWDTLQRVTRGIAERAREWWWALLLGIGLVTAVGTGIVLSFQVARTVAPQLEQAAQITDSKERLTVIKDLSQYQIDNQIKIWTGLVQAVGVVVLAVGG